VTTGQAWIQDELPVAATVTVRVLIDGHPLLVSKNSVTAATKLMTFDSALSTKETGLDG
jgi:hypothetical protein